MAIKRIQIQAHSNQSKRQQEEEGKCVRVNVVEASEDEADEEKTMVPLEEGGGSMQELVHVKTYLQLRRVQITQ